MSHVLAAQAWKSNAEMIADVARLGYLNGHVMDCTYGLGVFWKQWKPEKLTAHDRYTLDGVDFRNLPHPDGMFDSSVIDGPYQLMPEHFGGESALNQSREAQHAKAAELWNGGVNTRSGLGPQNWTACL